MSKKSKNNYFIFGIIVVLVLAIVAGIVFTNEGGDKEKTIKVGIGAPLTGAVSYQGERFVNGATLAMKEYNKNHKNNISLKIEDDKCSASKSTKVANRLINLKGINKIISYCGAASPPYIEHLQDKQDKIMFVSSIRLESAEEKYPFMFNLLPPAEDEMELLAKHIKNKGIAKVAMIYQQDLFGETYKSKFTSAFEELGGEVVLIEGYNTNKAKDFRTSLTKIKNSEAKGIINFVAHPGNYDTLLKNAKELNVNLPFFSQFITENPTLIELTGNRSEGITYTHPFKELKTQEFKEFENKYESEYQQEINIDSVNGYDVVMLIGQLAQECGNDAGCMNEKLNSNNSYKGVLGDMEFENYMKDGKYYIKNISNGEFVPIE